MTAEERLGLRERKKRETRVALSLATIRLSVERGWDNVTVEDIAATANVSVRTFRNYFSNKAEAVAAMHLDRAMRIADELRARPAEEPLWDAVSAAVQTHFTSGQRTDNQSTGLRELLAQPALQGEVLKADVAAQAELAVAIAERSNTDVNRDIYPNLLAAVTSVASATAVEHCLRTEPSGDLSAILKTVFDQLANGLANR